MSIKAPVVLHNPLILSKAVVGTASHVFCRTLCEAPKNKKSKWMDGFMHLAAIAADLHVGITWFCCHAQ